MVEAPSKIARGMTEIGVIVLPALLLLLAAVFYGYRAFIATAQSNFFGGKISAGCITAEALVLALLALMFLASHHAGVFSD